MSVINTKRFPRTRSKSLSLSLSLSLPITSGTGTENSYKFRRRAAGWSRIAKGLGACALLGATFLILKFSAILMMASTAYDQFRIPTYDEIYHLEASLPQHNQNLPFPEGRNGRYLKFSVPYHSIGFNNQLQDIIMAAQTSYMSGRAYVFQPFLNAEVPSRKPIQVGDHLKSTSVPLNALLSGPIAGGTMANHGQGLPNELLQVVNVAPRFVSYDYYDQVCPVERRVYVNIQDTRKELKIEEQDNPTGRQVLEKWSQKLLHMNDSCVEVGNDHLWQFWHFGRQSITTAWEPLSKSPIMAGFEWSPYIHRIVRRNWNLISQNPLLPSQQVPIWVPGLLAVHLRRGDFIPHCTNLREWGAVYGGWNQFPNFPDKFNISEPDKEANYNRHCLPDIQQILERIQSVRKDWHGLTKRTLSRIYILTNAEPEFLKPLRAALIADSWRVADTSEIVLHHSEVEIDMVADMMIAQIAEVFIGNGFSTLTSDVNLVRLAKAAPINSIRFW